VSGEPSVFTGNPAGIWLAGGKALLGLGEKKFSAEDYARFQRELLARTGRTAWTPYQEYFATRPTRWNLGGIEGVRSGQFGQPELPPDIGRGPPAEFYATDAYGRILDADAQAARAEQNALGRVAGLAVLAGVLQDEKARETSKAVLKRSEELWRQRLFKLRMAANKARGFGRALGRDVLVKIGGAQGLGQILMRRIPAVLATSQAAQIMQILGDAYQEHRIQQIENRPDRAELSDYAKAKLKELEKIANQAESKAFHDFWKKAAGQQPPAQRLAAQAKPRARPPLQKQDAELKRIGKAAAQPAAAAPSAPAPARTSPPATPVPLPSQPSPVAGIGNPRLPHGIPLPSLNTTVSTALLLSQFARRAPRAISFDSSAMDPITARNWLAQQYGQPLAGSGYRGSGGAIGTRCSCKPCQGSKKRRVGKRRARRKYKCIPIAA